MHSIAFGEQFVRVAAQSVQEYVPGNPTPAHAFFCSCCVCDLFLYPLSVSVTKLHLENNRLSDKGVIAIADAITAQGVQCSVHTLHLENNKITHKGAMALADAIKVG